MIGFVLRKMAASVGGNRERWEMRERERERERGREQGVGVEGEGDGALISAPPSPDSHR